MKKLLIVLVVFAVMSCGQNTEKQPEINTRAKQVTISFTIEEANRLAQLPLNCMQQEFPNKLNQTLGNASNLGTPKELHPAFYGCFDWHSSVHGHWMLVTLLKKFPELDHKDEIILKLQENITKENILIELEYFQDPHEKSYERTYGWAWLLKLAEELHTWDNPVAKELEANLEPLTNLIIERYIEFLPKLVYPIRVGEHTNTAFGLTFAWDYCNTTHNTQLKELIENRAKEFYLTDKGCPLSWEPSGYDFLSPCLEQADIMRRVLPKKEFEVWLSTFLPQIVDPDFYLEPAKVYDRTDGKLVHLDGLNFSRAWVLYGIANEIPELDHLKVIADEHMGYSLKSVTDGNYEGGHWLASFAVYAFTQQ